MIVQPGAPFPIKFEDSATISPFGRLAVSQTQSAYSSQQQYGDDPTLWETLNSGTGAITFLPNESTVQMSTGGTTSGASCIRQTKIYHRYIPSHGSSIYMTFVADSGATITNNVRRIGYFDSNNGIFFEINGGVLNVVERSYTSGTVSENRVPQSSWNVDKLDGTGPSGLILDITKAQILVIDLQWLGVGRVRIGFDINGVFYPCHYFENANALTTVYMTTANLPCRLENTNTGVASGTATLRHICTAVNIGGGAALDYGHQYSYNNGIAGTSIPANSRIPIISVRASTTGPNGVRNTGQIQIGQWDISASGTNPIMWELVLNGTLTGAAFTNYSSGISIADVDKTATAITGGVVLDSGYLSASNQNRNMVSNVSNIKQLILVYSSLLNNQDQITLVCSAGTGGSAAFCNIQWLELW